ncbi:retrovirus-related pol polyprotein from transposon TNT 1-94 [Tanacetum coccineum]
MSKQCTKPKRKRDDSWFKDKVLLVQAQASGQILLEEELAFLKSQENLKVKPTETTLHIYALVEVVQIVLWYLDFGCSKHMTGDRSQLTNFVNKFLGIVKFRNDHVAKILGYGDYHIGNVTISRVYYVEGLGHNLFSVGQFCDSNLEVAFRQHTCFIRNLEGVDLLTGSRGNNLYTLSLGEYPGGILLNNVSLAMAPIAVSSELLIEAMQEKLNEFERLKVWELVPRTDKVTVITLKCLYKVKLDELGGILKNKARLVDRGYRQEEGIDFEESLLRLQD